MKSLEQQLAEAKQEIVALTAKVTERDTTITTLNESAKTASKATAKAHLGQLIAEAGFPEKSVKLVTARLEKLFESAEKTDGMKEAVAGEVEYLKSVGGIVTPKIVRNNGGSIQESVQLTEAERVKAYMRKFRCTEKEARFHCGLD